MRKLYLFIFFLLPLLSVAQVEDSLRRQYPDTIKPRRIDTLQVDPDDFWIDTLDAGPRRILREGELESDTVRSRPKRRKFKFRYSDRIQYAFYLDWPMTAGAGIPGSLLLQKKLSHWQDELLPRFWEDDSTRWQRRRSVKIRALRMVLVEGTVETILLGLQQDLLGQYARAREFNPGGLSYSIGPPIPFWKSPGRIATNSNTDNSASRQQIAQVFAGASEASVLASDELISRWVLRKSINYREALHYLRIQFAGLAGALTVSNTPGKGVGAYENYLYYINREYGNISEYGYSAKDLKLHYSLATLTNPALYSSIYSVFVNYLAYGNDSMATPGIRLGYGKLLHPWVQYNFTPFGGEWMPELMLTNHRQSITAYGRIGTGHFGESVGGGLKINNLVRSTRYGLNLHVSLWKQQYFYRHWFNQSTEPVGWGGAAILTGYFKLNPTQPHPMSLVVQAGYKTRGYMPGELWGAAPVVRVGLSFALDRDYEQDDTVPEYEEIPRKKKGSKKNKRSSKR